MRMRCRARARIATMRRSRSGPRSGPRSNSGRRPWRAPALGPAGIASVVGLALVTAACGRTDDDRPARIKLTDLAIGDLSIAPDPEPDVVLLDADARDGTAGWRLMTDSSRPLDFDADLIRVRSEADGEVLTLSGRQGCLYRFLPVDPSTCYEFRGQARARGIVPVSSPFYGANLMLVELSAFGTSEEIAVDGIEHLIEKRHVFESSVTTPGEWHAQHELFRTGPKTRGLLVACALGLGAGQEVTAGEVDFRAVDVRRISDRRYREHLLDEAIARFNQGEDEPQGWRAERYARASLGAEVRPSIILLPGDSLRLFVEVPHGVPVFEFGVGPWWRAVADARESDRGYEAGFSVTIDGEEVATCAGSGEVAESQADLRWHDHSIGLSAHAGETVDFTFFASGDLPVAFGAPTVRDRDFVAERPNLVLVSIDTLRRDRVSCYGYEEKTTPRIDEFARGAIVFDDAHCQAPYTLPSHATMFSGQFPSVHGIQAGGHVLSGARSPLLARTLSDAGYRTQAFTGGGFLNPDFGFDKGFDGFVNVDPLRQRGSKFLTELSRREPDRYPPELVNALGPQRVREWLREHSDEPFFLFVHTYTVHDYDPPDGFNRCEARGCTNDTLDIRNYKLGPKRGWNPHPYTEDERAHLGHLYDDSLRYIDREVGVLLDEIDRLGLDENTIVVITTDHGEEMLERGFVQHGKTLYDEIGRIPMIVRIPGEAARRVDSPAMLVDLMPTLMAHMGIPRDPRMQGIDLLSVANTERPVWSEIRDAFVHRYAMRDESDWKLIHNPADDTVHFPGELEWELYDLTDDPGERTNLVDRERDRFDVLRARLESKRAALAKIGAGLGEIGTGELDPATAAQLRKLGYVDE